MAVEPFKVIVVGGGPVGLVAAHALSHAGIDFVLLERRDSVVLEAGSNIVISADTMRVFAQLGILDEMEKYSEELSDIHRFDHRGRDMGNLHWFRIFKELLGKYPRVLSRHDLTMVLHQALSDEAKTKILAGKKITHVESTAEGMSVSCEDGTTYSGQLVIGADGAHSTIRQSMRTLALTAGSDQVNDEKPFLTTYRCLWIRFPTSAIPDLKPGATVETHGYGASTQLFVGDKTGVAGVYERLETPITDRVRYTQQDQEECIKKWGFLPLAKNHSFTLADAYENRVQSGLVSLEEGVVEHWSWGGRVVLVGDAAHKFTPSTGAGCNQGIGDVVVLANALYKAFAAAGPGSAPSEQQVAGALATYRELRHRAVSKICRGAALATATSTWATGMSRFFDQWVFRYEFMQRWLVDPKKGSFQAYVNGPVLDYVAAEEPFAGALPWTNPMPTKAEVVKA